MQSRGRGQRAGGWRGLPPAVRILLLIGLAVVLLTLIGRLLLSPLAVWITNKRLEELPGYTGKVEDINFRLLAGRYSIEGTDIRLADRPRPAPVFQSPDVDVRLLWEGLFRGRIIGSVVVDSPTINLYQRMFREKPKKPEKKAPPPGVAFRRTIPVSIDEFSIDDGEIHFKNYLEKPYFDLYLTNVDLRVRNITNRRRLDSANYATIDLSALAMGSGEVDMHATVNPTSRRPTFFVAFKLIGLQLSSLNKFTHEFAGVDFERGSFDLVTEITVDNGRIDGYVKPFFRDMTIFSWDKDVQERGQEISESFWEALVGAGGEVLENQPRDQLATRIPLSGEISEPDISIEEAIINVLRNAFVAALLPTLEGGLEPPAY